MSGVEELQDALRNGRPVTDDDLLIAAAELLRDSDELINEQRAEIAELRLCVAELEQALAATRRTTGPSPRPPSWRLRSGRRG
jgi:hypothetical protein